MKTKLWAILHDGTFDGDSAFFCPDDKIAYKDGETLRDIKKRFLDFKRKELKATVEDKDELAEIAEDYDAKGAWIVDNNTIKLLESIWDAADPCDDSGTYITNRIAKRMACILSVKKFGKEARIEGWRASRRRNEDG